MNITNHHSSTRETVAPEIMATWKKLYIVGDIVQIAKQYDLSISTVGIAFKGVATKATVGKINDYYGISTVESPKKEGKNRGRKSSKFRQ